MISSTSIVSNLLKCCSGEISLCERALIFSAKRFIVLYCFFYIYNCNAPFSTENLSGGLVFFSHLKENFFFFRSGEVVSPIGCSRSRALHPPFSLVTLVPTSGSVLWQKPVKQNNRHFTLLPTTSIIKKKKNLFDSTVL